AAQQAIALTDCLETEEKLAAQVHAAEVEVTAAQDRLDAAQRAHAAAGLAQTLHVGADCPVCGQLVQALPGQQAPADLSAARSAVESAGKSQRQAGSAHQEAVKAAAAAQSALAGTQARLDKAAEVMADALAEAELVAQLDAIVA